MPYLSYYNMQSPYAFLISKLFTSVESQHTLKVPAIDFCADKQQLNEKLLLQFYILLKLSNGTPVDLWESFYFILIYFTLFHRNSLQSVNICTNSNYTRLIILSQRKRLEWRLFIGHLLCI